jgi:hypothetical protein
MSELLANIPAYAGRLRGLFDRGDLAAFPILMEGQVADSGGVS